MWAILCLHKYDVLFDPSHTHTHTHAHSCHIKSSLLAAETVKDKRLTPEKGLHGCSSSSEEDILICSHVNSAMTTSDGLVPHQISFHFVPRPFPAFFLGDFLSTKPLSL